MSGRLIPPRFSENAGVVATGSFLQEGSRANEIDRAGKG